jgi:hypothetical protein
LAPTSHSTSIVHEVVHDPSLQRYGAQLRIPPSATTFVSAPMHVADAPGLQAPETHWIPLTQSASLPHDVLHPLGAHVYGVQARGDGTQSPKPLQRLTVSIPSLQDAVPSQVMLLSG